jgi:hypothetical protein
VLLLLLVVALATSGGSRATNATPQPPATTLGGTPATTSSADGSRPTVPAGPPASKPPPPIAATKDAAAAKTADNADLPNWTVPADLESELGAEVACGIFKIRPPSGFQSAPASSRGSLDYVWCDLSGSGDIATMVGVNVADLPAHLKAATLESQLDRQMVIMRSYHDNFTMMPMELGRINGLAFARVRWNGVKKLRDGRRGPSAQGVFYVAATRDRNTLISIVAAGMTSDALKRVEASILSLRLVIP